MIFFLEIDGKLKKCFVFEPFSSELRHWNMVRWASERGGYSWDLATKELESISEQVVEAGAYEVREP